MSNPTIFIAAIAIWLGSWYANTRLSRLTPGSQAAATAVNLAIPFLFGVAILALWEGITRGFDVPTVLLPPPSMIWERITGSTAILWADFQQTYLKAVLAGYVIGCGAGFVVAVLVDRSPFLKAGVMPVGNLVSALPIIGIAPIMVMWFGFDWPVQGGGGRGDDLLPDAGEHGRPASPPPATWSAT